MIQITKNISLTFVSALIIASSVSCDHTKKYEEEEKDKIQAYLNENPDLNFELKESGLYYFDTVVGTGSSVEINDSVFVMYSGKLLDGSEFDTNYDDKDTLSFRIGQGLFIPGFEEGISYMKVGGKTKLLLPSSLAFGNYSYYWPPYTPVTFDVELTKVIPDNAK